MYVLFLEGFLFVYILSVSMVKFWFLTQFIGDILSQSYLVLFSFCLSKLHSLIIWLNVSSLSPLAILLHIINLYFNVIGPNGVFFCFFFELLLKEIQFFLYDFSFPSLVILSEISTVFASNIRIVVNYSHFCFLFVIFLYELLLPILLLTALVNLSLFFLMWATRPCHCAIINTSEIYSPFLFQFFDNMHL